MTENTNPFLTAYHTPFETIPFHLIKTEHFEPAIEEGMKVHNQEVDAIIHCPDEPTFHNTIVALEKSGSLLDRVSTVFGNLLSAETSDELEAIAERVMPRLSEHSNNISLNEKLFARIKQVYDETDKEALTPEERMLLQNTYNGFIRSGANLAPEQKERFRQLSAELSVLTLKFSQNNLKETNRYELLLTPEQTDGLPQSALDAYAQAAKDKNQEGYLVTLQAPSFVPFMKYSNHRELRQQLYMAYNTQCTHDDEFNNLEIVQKIVNLRLERAQLLGYPTVADYVLSKRMAENSENVWWATVPYLRAVPEFAEYNNNAWTKLPIVKPNFAESLFNRKPLNSNSSGNEVLNTAYTTIGGIAVMPNPANSEVAVSTFLTNQ